MFPDSENSAAALVKDGKLIAMAEEERFNRIKHSKGHQYPEKAIEFCLKQAGITIQNVARISVGWASVPTTLWMTLISSFKNPISLLRFPGVISRLKGHKEYNPFKKINYYPHHMAHAASSFLVSGFPRANIISMDGQGEATSVLLAVGHNSSRGQIDKIKEYSILNSIGSLYESFTDYLGFVRHSHEGYVMGLASYGRPICDYSPLINWKKNGYSCGTLARYSSIFSNSFRKIQGKKVESIGELLIKNYGPKRNRNDPLTKRHQDIAATIQNIQEKAVIKLARYLYEKNGIQDFCLAGGSALNCISNGFLLEQDFVKNIYVQPASSDAGVAIGAAFLDYVELTGESIDFKMEHAYWGPEYTNEEIEKVLKEKGIEYEYHEEIEKISAELIAKGNIIGWFQGRMEFGPRALGNRSILADPTDENMKDKVNNQVKHRECYDKKTEILTNEGWKKFKDISDEEIVATLNPETNELEYQKIINKIKYKYDGQMIRFNNQRIDLLVTPNHKIWHKWIQNNNKNAHLKHPFKFEEARNILGKKHLQLKAINKWEGKEKKYFILPKIKARKYSHIFQYRKIPMDLWLEFLGYYLSEGSFCYNQGHHYILVSQDKKSKHYKRMEKCLSNLPYNWSYSGRSFRTSNKQLYNYLKQFKKCDGKFIPKDFLDLSERQLRILLEALMCGDGHKRNKQYKYFTTSKKLAENVQEICIKLGYSVYTSKEIRSPLRKDLYIIRANKGSKISWVQKNQIGLEDYNGIVYCVNVPKYHILCVKRNEKVVFSGNSWRPFCPSILEESADEYLENAYPSPFMILSFRVKRDKWKVIPSVIHVDGTARPQTVSKKTNPRYHKLISEFEKIKGVPVVLNTSFNDSGEPIVCSPEDAIRSFKNTNLDYLAIGNFLIKREGEGY